MKLGFTELLLVFIVALIAVGPDRLPAYARKLGVALGQFRKYSEEATRDIKESIVEPLEEAQRPLREAMEPLEELDKTVRGNVREVQNSFSNIGKKPSKANAKSDTTSDTKATADTEASSGTESATDSEVAVNTEASVSVSEAVPAANSDPENVNQAGKDFPEDAAEEREMDKKSGVITGD